MGLLFISPCHDIGDNCHHQLDSGNLSHHEREVKDVSCGQLDVLDPMEDLIVFTTKLDLTMQTPFYFCLNCEAVDSIDNSVVD